MTTGLFTHEHCTRHDMGDWHPESPARLAAIMDYLKASGLLSELEEHEAVHVSREALARAHPERYLAALDKLHPPEGLSWADPDTALNIYTLDAAARAAGGVVAAVQAVLAGSLANAFCAVRPPGHHAERAMAIVERPRKLPISTMRPAAGTAAARAATRASWSGLNQPSTPSRAAARSLGNNGSVVAIGRLRLLPLPATCPGLACTAWSR